MKILQILHPGLGGTSTVAFSLVDSQKYIKLKVENYFLFNGNEEILKQYKDKCLKKKINFIFYKLTFPFSTTLKVLNYITKVKPNVIINHSNSVFPTYIYKLLNKKKFIYVDHSPDKTRGIKNWIKTLFNWILSDYIIFVSYRKKNHFIFKLLNFLKKKFKVILNAIDTKKFKNDKFFVKNFFKVGMAARFVDDKLQIILLKIFEKNRNYFKKKKVILSLAGEGPNYLKYKKKYEKNSQIHFVGNLNERKIVKWFNGLSIYAHLSKDETTSTSILQAISSEIPLILSKVDGNINLIDSLKISKYCRLVSNDEKNIKKAILENFLNKESFYLAKKLKKKVENKIDLRNFFNQYLQVARSISNETERNYFKI